MVVTGNGNEIAYIYVNRVSCQCDGKKTSFAKNVFFFIDFNTFSKVVMDGNGTFIIKRGVFFGMDKHLLLPKMSHRCFRTTKDLKVWPYRVKALIFAVCCFVTWYVLVLPLSYWMFVGTLLLNDFYVVMEKVV